MKLLKKGLKLYSIIYCKCPRCHETDLFVARAYDLRNFTKMPEACSVCGQRFELELSFYTGAMYVSYALQVALFTTVFVALRVLFNPPANVYIYTIIAAAVALFPLTFRLSRSIYINLFVSYRDPSAAAGNN